MFSIWPLQRLRLPTKARNLLEKSLDPSRGQELVILRKTTSWVNIPALPSLGKHCLSARSSPKHALWAGVMPTPARSRHVEQFCQAPGHSSQLRSHTQFQAPAPSPGGHLGASWALETHDQALGAQSWLGRFQSKPFSAHSCAEARWGSCSHKLTF